MDDDTNEAGEQIERNKWARWNWSFYLIHLVAMAIAFGLTASDFIPLAWGATACLWITMFPPLLFWTLPAFFNKDGSRENKEIRVILFVCIAIITFLTWRYFFGDAGSNVKGSLFIMMFIMAYTNRLH